MMIWKFIKYIMLGVIQGITEPIPVSSSGHLLVFRTLFNTNMFNDLNYEIILNFGSFLAILFIFRKDVTTLLKSFFNYLFSKDEKTKKENKTNFKYCLCVIIATIPVGIVGILLKDKLENALSNIKLVGIAFLITALSLILVKNIKGTKEDKDISYKDAILIGLLQAIAIVPGLSRSGTTLVGCLLRNFKRDTALKFTFILYFPVSIATIILGLVDLLKTNYTSILPFYIAGFIASLIITYFSSKWFFDVVKKGKLWKFAIYCTLLGLFTIIVL